MIACLFENLLRKIATGSVLGHDFYKTWRNKEREREKYAKKREERTTSKVKGSFRGNDICVFHMQRESQRTSTGFERRAKEFEERARSTREENEFPAFFHGSSSLFLFFFFFIYFLVPMASAHASARRLVCFWQPNNPARRCTAALGRRPNVINFKSGHCFSLHLARTRKRSSREQRTDHRLHAMSTPPFAFRTSTGEVESFRDFHIATVCPPCRLPGLYIFLMDLDIDGSILAMNRQERAI